MRTEQPKCEAHPWAIAADGQCPECMALEVVRRRERKPWVKHTRPQRRE